MKYLDVPSSGSIADRTHSHNRAGQYTRNRRAPVQPIGSGRRAFVRNAFATASSGWSALTNAQQEAWISFAADHPITDALGQSIVLTGHQMYVAVTVNLLNVGSGSSTSPPASTAVTDLSDAVASYTVAGGVAVTATGGAGTGSVAIAVSKPMSAGRRFNKTFWQPLGADGFILDDSFPYALTAAKYTAEFGTVVAGQALFVKLTPVNVGGWAGSPRIIRVIAT